VAGRARRPAETEIEVLSVIFSYVLQVLTALAFAHFAAVQVTKLAWVENIGHIGLFALCRLSCSAPRTAQPERFRIAVISQLLTLYCHRWM
jgi:hypothetical protein